MALRTLFAALLLACLVVPGPHASAAVMTGGGTALVSQFKAGAGQPASTGEVNLAAGLAEGVLPGSDGTVFRIQFVRPDRAAVAFLVWSVPVSGALTGTFAAGQDGLGLVYYEQALSDPEHKLFLSNEWDGQIVLEDTVDVDGRTIRIGFHCAVSDWGADGQAQTADDLVRTIEKGWVVFARHGDLSGVQYYETGGVVYVYEEPIVYYDDGCSGDPGSSDDYYYDDYDSSSDDQAYDDGSCDGDAYDDDYDDSDDSGDDWDWSDDSDDSGDDWDWSDDSDDDRDSYDDSGDDGDTYDQASGAFRVRTMSWAAAIASGNRARPLFAGVLLPALLAAGVLLILKHRSRPGTRV